MSDKKDQPEEKWFRIQEFISNADRRIAKLVSVKDKKEERWMGFAIVLIDDNGVVTPQPERFPIPAADFQDACNKFQKAYEDHTEKMNQDIQADTKRIKFPEKESIVTPGER